MGKRNSLFNLIIQQSNIGEIYSYNKDPYEAKYQFLINKRESISLKCFNHSKDIYKIIKEYNAIKKT